MIRFYYHPTPNPLKISLFLEEDPNGKVPAIVDTDGPGGKEARVFDSSAILLYLTEKAGKFGGSPEDRPELLARPVLRPGSAFSVGGACRLRLRCQSLQAGSGAALSGD